MTSLARPTRSSGFTLLELMVTITLAAILLGIAIPAFRNLSLGSRQTGQVNDFVSAINLARSEAIKRNTTISLCRTATATATACVTSTGTWVNWIVATAGGSVIRRGIVDSSNNTIVVDSDLTQDTVAFGSDGLARTGGALVSYKKISVKAAALSTDKAKCIRLEASGRISVEKSNTGTCP